VDALLPGIPEASPAILGHRESHRSHKCQAFYGGIDADRPDFHIRDRLVRVEWLLRFRCSLTTESENMSEIRARNCPFGAPTQRLKHTTLALPKNYCLPHVNAILSDQIPVTGSPRLSHAIPSSSSDVLASYESPSWEQ
jgi:hypothetical protein